MGGALGRSAPRACSMLRYYASDKPAGMCVVPPSGLMSVPALEMGRMSVARVTRCCASDTSHYQRPAPQWPFACDEVWELASLDEGDAVLSVSGDFLFRCSGKRGRT
jgi:hypothetical protein